MLAWVSCPKAKPKFESIRNGIPTMFAPEISQGHILLGTRRKKVLKRWTGAFLPCQFQPAPNTLFVSIANPRAHLYTAMQAKQSGRTLANKKYTNSF